MATLYYGSFVDTPRLGELRIRHNTAVVVDQLGKITAIESPCADQSALAKEHNISVDKIKHQSSESATRFFVPGFIDTHTHASQYPNTGIFGNSTLLDWLDTYTFPLESSYTSTERAAHVYNRVVSRGLSHGTTCAAYYATIHVEATNLLADICLSKGQRALIGRVCMDRLSPEHYRDASPQVGVDATKAVMQHLAKIDPAGAIVRPVITPRFAPSCTDESLKLLGDLHRETGCYVQTHISENHPEINFVKELFPDSKHYADVYDKAGLLGDKTILAHAVHLTPEEVTLIRQRQTALSHCPTSNTCLTSGAARLRSMLDAGLIVGLGTDMSGGYSPSILEMARQAILVSRHAAMIDGDAAKLTAEEVLYLATAGGARVVGLQDKVGVFEVGMDFDAQAIALGRVDEKSTGLDSDAGPVDIFGWESWEDRVAKWLYCGDDRNVRRVFVKGRLVHSLEA